jgi:predicted permease
MSWGNSEHDLLPGSDTPIGRLWWQPLVSLINFILLGFCAKTFFGWPPSMTTKVRRYTFNILLPIYIFRNMWVAQIESSMSSIAKVSFFIHCAQGLFWGVVFRNIQDARMRGWLQMISQGCLTSFFYSNLESHLDFGHQAVAICLLFDIGGNTPCAQGYLWGLAAYFAPRNNEIHSPDFQSTFSSPLMATVPSDRHTLMDQDRKTIRLSLNDLRLAADTFETDSLLDHRSEQQSYSIHESLRKIVSAVLFQPVLPAFVIGLLFSLNNIGCPVYFDIAMETVGLFFKPSLYFLIGLCSEFVRDGPQMKIILTALGFRYLFCGTVALLVWLWLPFGAVERTTMALCLLSPVSTMTMYLVAEYGYPKKFVTMSAGITTISVFVSFFIQEAVLRSF